LVKENQECNGENREFLIILKELLKRSDEAGNKILNLQKDLQDLSQHEVNIFNSPSFYFKSLFFFEFFSSLEFLIFA